MARDGSLQVATARRPWINGIRFMVLVWRISFSMSYLEKPVTSSLHEFSL